MDYLADMGIVHCPECGRLFRPREDDAICAGCRGEDVSIIEAARHVSPHERAAAFYRIFDEHVPDAVGDGPINAEEAAVEAPACKRCRKQPATPGTRYCLECRIFLEQSLKQAAGDVFGRIRDIQKNRGKSKAFHVHESISEKRNMVPGQGPNYSGAPRYKY